MAWSLIFGSGARVRQAGQAQVNFWNKESKFSKNVIQFLNINISKGNKNMDNIIK